MTETAMLFPRCLHQVLYPGSEKFATSQASWAISSPSGR